MSCPRYAIRIVGLLLYFIVDFVRSENFSRKNAKNDNWEAHPTPSYIENTPTGVKRPRLLDNIYPTRSPFTCPPTILDKVELPDKVPKYMRKPKKNFINGLPFRKEAVGIITRAKTMRGQKRGFNSVKPFHEQRVWNIPVMANKPSQHHRQYKNDKGRSGKDSKASKQSKTGRSSWGRKKRGGKS